MKQHEEPKRNRSRRAVRMIGLRESLGAKLLKVCADIGRICGWRETRLELMPSARRSSRKRVMLGRALAAEAREQGNEAFRPVEATFAPGGRSAYVQVEPVAEAASLSDFALDVQDELARLARMGISASEVAWVVGDARVRSRGQHRPQILWRERVAE